MDQIELFYGVDRRCEFWMDDGEMVRMYRDRATVQGWRVILDGKLWTDERARMATALSGDFYNNYAVKEASPIALMMALSSMKGIDVKFSREKAWSEGKLRENR